jgi:hypothetical protein
MMHRDQIEDNPPLGVTWRDQAIALTKGGLGAIPFVGALLGEIVGSVIPEQRLQRIEAFLVHLANRLDAQEIENLKQRLQEEPETADLLEEGITQSVRAISDVRKQYIAQLVANGISGKDKSRIEAKRMIKLLAQIDDDQVIILTSYLSRHHDDEGFRNKHEALMTPVAAVIGSDQETLDAEALYELARAELIRLGLLRIQFKRPAKGQLPEFDDKTGMMKARSRELTLLGRLLLTRIGLAELGEF